MESVKNYFSTLPDLCLEKILDCLPVSDLLNAEKVCSRWRTLSGNVWKSKKGLRFIDSFDYDDVDLALCRSGEFITSLLVQKPSDGHSDKAGCCFLSSKIIIPIGYYCKNLEHLSFYNLCCFDREAFSFLLDCASTRLVSFHLQGRHRDLPNNYTTSHDIATLLEKSSNLEKLSLTHFHLSNMCLSQLSRKCKHLNIINGCHFENGLPSVLRTLTNLEILEVCNIEEISPLLHEFPTLYPNLQQLNLSDIRNVSESDLDQLLLLQNLKHLKVSYLESMTTIKVISFAETFKSQLEVFHCPYCRYVTNSAFCRMIELCPNLKSLNVVDCFLISSRLLVEASFALRGRKNKINLEIQTSLKRENFPESQKKMLTIEIHPLLDIRYTPFSLGYW